MYKKWLITTCLYATLSTAAQAAYTPFTLNINYQGGLTSSQISIFEQARGFWESQIIGYDGPINFTPGLNVSAVGEAVDGVNGVLGSAGPTAGYYNTGSGLNGKLYATQGAMRFDTADLGWLETSGKLLDVVIHELAHVIGFGTLWTHNGLYTNGSGQYLGSYAVSMYQNEFSATTNYIPVELNIGPGSDNGHWAENWLGGSNELMTSYLGSEPYISNTTLASFQDLGYLVSYALNNVEIPSDVPTPAGIAALGLGLMLIGAKRKRASKNTPLLAV